MNRRKKTKGMYFTKMIMSCGKLGCFAPNRKDGSLGPSLPHANGIEK
jgi:hypothetical protein